MVFVAVIGGSLILHLERRGVLGRIFRLSVKNSVVWDAGEWTIEILPKFLEHWGDKSDPKTSKALQYQITELDRYKA